MVVQNVKTGKKTNNAWVLATRRFPIQILTATSELLDSHAGQVASECRRLPRGGHDGGS